MEEERKHLIGLIAYRFGEICNAGGIDGLWISNMAKIVDEAENYEFPLDENGVIVTDIVYDNVDEIAYRLYDEEVKHD